jgi:hypothetical protein
VCSYPHACTIYDDKLIVSHGKVDAYRELAAESAALLSISQVSDWQTITVDHDIVPGEIENFISKTAGAHGLDPEGPFPFEIRGTLVSYVMHPSAL